MLRKNQVAGHIKNLWSNLPSGAQSVFRTDGRNNTAWRQLIAFDPIDTFILDDPLKIPDLQAFLHEHQHELCAGYLSYDLGLHLHDVNSRHSQQHSLAIFHAYENWLEVHGDQVRIIASDQSFRTQIQQLLEVDSPVKNYDHSLDFEASIQQNSYTAGLLRQY